MLEPVTAGVGKLTPRAEGEREVGAVDEVVAADPVLDGCVLQMMRKSSGWWMWIVKSPGRNSRVVYSVSATSSVVTTGLVPVMEATIPHRSTSSAFSISID